MFHSDLDLQNDHDPSVELFSCRTSTARTAPSTAARLAELVPSRLVSDRGGGAPAPRREVTTGRGSVGASLGGASRLRAELAGR